MKNKDGNFIQQHVEKVILGAAVVFALLVLWVYYFSSPYKVSIAGHDNVKPAEVPNLALTQAQLLKQRLDNERSPLPSMPLPRYTDEFRSRLARPILAVDQFEMPLSYPGLDIQAFPAEPPTRPMVTLPAPVQPLELTARGGFGVLGEQIDLELDEALTALVGDHTPRDILYATAQATFDFDAWGQAIQAVPADHRVPENWWKGRRVVSAVTLERQELDPITGRWSQPQVVEPIPTARYYGLEERDREFAPGEATDLVDVLYMEQEFIRRAPFPALSVGVWQPPDAEGVELTPEQQRRVLELNRQVNSLRQRINRLQRDGGMQPGAAPMGPIDEFGPPGPAPRPTPPRPAAGATRDTSAQLTQLQQELIARQTELNEIFGINEQTPMMSPDMMMDLPRMRDPRDPRRQLMDPDFYDEGLGMPRDRRGALRPDQPAVVDEGGKIKVWAHDLTVEPGKTYRYRIIVHVLNPLFQRRDLPPEQREEHFNKVALASQPSNWSDPVRIDPRVQFFLARAEMNEATVEVFRIFNGAWKVERFRVRPGDAIGGIASATLEGEAFNVDMHVNALVVDIRETVSAGQVGTVYELLYYDMDRGGLQTRTVAGDANDRDYIRLKSEAARGAIAALPAP